MFAEEAVPSIASLFNLSLSPGKLPNDWKHSNVFPIPKEANKFDVQFYRPILPMHHKQRFGIVFVFILSCQNI